MGTYTSGRISTRGNKDIKRRVKSQSVDTTEMSVVVANDLVGLQIPALDHLVISTREQVRVAWGDSQSTNLSDMSCQRKL